MCHVDWTLDPVCRRIAPHYSKVKPVFTNQCWFAAAFLLVISSVVAFSGDPRHLRKFPVSDEAKCRFALSHGRPSAPPPLQCCSYWHGVYRRSVSCKSYLEAELWAYGSIVTMLWVPFPSETSLFATASQDFVWARNPARGCFTWAKVRGT